MRTDLSGTERGFKAQYSGECWHYYYGLYAMNQLNIDFLLQTVSSKTTISVYNVNFLTTATTKIFFFKK